MRKLIFISILILLIGCGTFQLTTLNHDPLYHIPDSNIQVEVLDTEFETVTSFELGVPFENDDEYKWPK